MAKRLRSNQVLGMGSEPLWVDEFTQSKLIDALNYYNYCYGQKEAKDFIISYCKEKKKDSSEIEKIKSVPESKILPQVGWVARMMSVGMSPDESTEDFFLQSYEKLLSYNGRRAEDVDKKDTPQRVSVQERILERAREEAGEIEGIIDDFRSSGYSKKYDMEKYFKTKNLSSVVLSRICEMFVESSREISEALSGSDEQMKEAYGHLRKPELRKLSELYDSIVSAANKVAIENKPIKRKRRVKEKPLTQIVSNVKYLKSFGDVIGQPIEKVVGASQVWVYNTKTKLLGVYNTDNAKGLTFKGTTLKNIDEKTSVGKKLRKPEVVIPELLSAGKIKMKKILPELTTKEIALTGRFNCDTIVLKIL